MSPPKHYETRSMRVSSAILKVENQKSIMVFKLRRIPILNQAIDPSPPPIEMRTKNHFSQMYSTYMLPFKQNTIIPMTGAIQKTATMTIMMTLWVSKSTSRWGRSNPTNWGMMFTMKGMTIAMMYDNGHIIELMKSLQASGIWIMSNHPSTIGNKYEIKSRTIKNKERNNVSIC